MAAVERVPRSTGKKAIALSILFAILLGQPGFAAAAPVRLIDVVSISWPGARPMGATVFDAENAIRNVVAPNWREFTRSQGSPEDSSIEFAPGIISTESIGLTRQMACEGTSSLTLMSSIQREFYRIQKISNYDDRYLLIMTPDAGCIWQGKALLGEASSKGGVVTLHNTASGFVITHEIGHTFGLGHSNLMSCSNNASDGAWGRNCRAIEYGGAIDVMGNVETTSPLSTYHQWRMGLIPNKFIHQSWINESITLSASDVYGATRAIFIRDDKATYWIEYRRGFGQTKPGLAIYRTDPPPNSAIDSPNPLDFFAPEPTMAITTDLWLLNWDDFQYSTRPTSSSGSMTLPQGRTATLFSGNISLSAQAGSDPTAVTVNITRRADTTPPPTPAFSNPLTWRSADTDIVIKGREDNESKIAYFELRVDGAISRVTPSTSQEWTPTYLEPLSAPATVFVKDLPEGSYQLAIRSADVWGNISPWSSAQAVTIDRTVPQVTNAIEVRKIEKTGITLAWTGARDGQSGLCETSLANSDGWITQRSTVKENPLLTLPLESARDWDTAVFDCFGNGVRGTLSTSAAILSATSISSRTGKWSTSPTGSLSCSGSCSLSLSLQNKFVISLSSGQAELRLSSQPRVVARSGAPTSLEVGAKTRVLRITGSNFTIASMATLRFHTQGFASAQRSVAPVDTSLTQSEQRELSALGFRASDFADGWSVLPMSRGTTLLDPTLDLCAATFASESDRLQRRQMVATKSDSAYEFLSSEVVKYANATAATNAFNELKAVFQQCLANKGGTSAAGLFTPYQFYELPSNADISSLEKNRVIVRATLGVANAQRQLLAIYQYRGAFFTGLYLTRAGEITMSDEEVNRWLSVAAVMASRLRTQ